MSDDREKVIRVDDDGEKRDPKVFVILGVMLVVVGLIFLRFDGSQGMGWAFTCIGGLVLLYGLIAGAVRTGIESARED